MELGSEHDRNQEGLFDKVESLDLNYTQAASLSMAISQQINESKRALEYFESLSAKDIDEHEMLTLELLQEETSIHESLIINLSQVYENLKEVVMMLEPEDGIVKPRS